QVRGFLLNAAASPNPLASDKEQGVTSAPTSNAAAGVSTSVEAAGGLRLLPIRPNPTRSAVQLMWRSNGDRVRLEVLDLGGRIVRVLVPRDGVQELAWDLSDQDRRRVDPGIYFVRLSRGGRVSSARVSVLP